MSFRDPHIKLRRFTMDEIHFVLMNLIHVGSPRKIQKDFEDTFDKKISAKSIENIKNSEKFQPTLDKLRDEYQKGLAREYMTSKRKRVAASQEIYEKAMARKDYKLASEQIMNVDQMLSPKHNVNLHQTNIYGDMNLQEIRLEKERLLKQIRDVSIKGEENGGT